MTYLSLISIAGDWILLTYASGDVHNQSDLCQNRPLKTSVMITCNKESDEVHSLKFSLINICVTLVVTASKVCFHNKEKGVY